MPKLRGEVSWEAVHDASRYKRLARNLREAGRGDLQRKLTRAIRQEGAPALAAVRSAFLSIDVTSASGPGGGGSTGLRGRVAAATRISILGSGIRVQVNAKRVDPRYGRTLTYGLDGLGRWRYPIYGNRNNWGQNYGTEVFYTTLRRFEPNWRRGIQRAMDDTARQIVS